MTNTELQEIIKSKFAEDISFDEQYDMLNVEIKKENLISVIEFLRDENSLQFNFLTDICGIHYPENKGKELGVIYHLHSWSNNIRIRIKVFLPVENPAIPSLTKIFSAADWMERETYDFYGILFGDHPNLTRILNEETMDYFPMRKEYKLEDGTRTDKDDRFFGRDGHNGQEFDKRYIK